MAYGAILGQMPQIDGIPAVIETYPIATGNTITQGDVVDVVDGQIQKTLTPQANVETIFNNQGVDNIYTFSTANDQIVVFFRNNGVSLATNILSKSGYVLSPDSIKTLKSSFSVETAFCKRDNTHFSFTYMSNNRMYFQNVVVSGNTSSSINLDGSEHVLWKDYTLMSIHSQFCLGIDSTHFLSVFSTDGGDLVAVLCDSSSSSVPTTWKSMSLKGAARYISATRLPDSGTTRRVCVCYSDGGDSNKGKAVIVSINNSNSVTWGTPVVFATKVTTTYNSPISVASDKQNCVVAYSNAQDSNKLYACALLISGTSIFTGNNNSITSAGFSDIALSFINENFVAVGQLGGSGVNGVSYMISSQADLVGVGFTYNNAGTRDNSICPISSDSVLVSYSDTGNSSYGTATVLTVSGNQIAGSFLDSSKDAIALQSGTSGQSIEVIYSGITNADWVTADQTITSDGVYGVGVLDGVLQVWSAERPRQVVTGSYKGNGQSGSSSPNTLTFNFEPKLVMVFRPGVSIWPFYSMDNYADASSYCLFLAKGVTSVYLNKYGSTVTFSIGSNSISWYCSSAILQLNEANVNYNYLAIG